MNKSYWSILDAQEHPDTLSTSDVTTLLKPYSGLFRKHAAKSFDGDEFANGICAKSPECEYVRKVAKLRLSLFQKPDRFWIKTTLKIPV